MDYTLDFEKPVQDLENQIKELKEAANNPGIDISKEISALQKKVDSMIKDIYTNLSPWERVQLSRHPKRPHTSDYINLLIDDFHEVHGDRKFLDDKSMISGFGFFEGQKVCVIGIEKGRKTQDKIQRNFGMASPEGYRKALRIMELAARFNVPVITFVDTPGAYPGIGAEERGQASAIAENLAEIFGLKVPIISIVIGEGGSGGALGIAIADKVYMMEYSVYSVISPESCASILWSNPKKAMDAANSLKLGPLKAKELGIIDGIIKEPTGGAHKDPSRASENIKEVISKDLKKLLKLKTNTLMENRFDKFRQMGNQTISTDKK
ncbi:MAG: acetyl-CoA carboxylase carboxyltransferase subunit alpha [Bacteriovoracaceae bacterium]|jgi:acetyl-CoA carboxylase carboxyl transferase subunit alpha|nr:acetyl-CoA carboxylase carboxyltransferase subunit alpha [Bacteriovoracaceae bacterium]